jgi:hypothetical protein
MNGTNAILMLEKLHCIQELICLCQTFLSPNQACLRSIVQQSIKMLAEEQSADMAKVPEFTFAINGTHVKDQISK